MLRCHCSRPCEAEADINRSASVLWHLRVAEGDHLSERNEGRKLPQHKTRALAVLRKLKTLLGGAPAWGKGGLLGAAPLLGPLCTPPGAPPREFSASAKQRGHASCAAGASFPRCAQSGDLPPRRVNAKVRLRRDWFPFQPNTSNICDLAVRPLLLRISRFSHP